LVDLLQREQRSLLMSRVRQRNSAPELAVRSCLHRLGLRFSLHSSKLPGTPDIVLSRHRTVVFVHGCFWHRHCGCKKATTPKTRTFFWTEKFLANIKRDRRVRRRLGREGWQVMTVWECQTKSRARLETHLKRRLGRILEKTGRQTITI
jgi:DNA mismatch endonuclease (patch repair protein)